MQMVKNIDNRLLFGKKTERSLWCTQLSLYQGWKSFDSTIKLILAPGVEADIRQELESRQQKLSAFSGVLGLEHALITPLLNDVSEDGGKFDQIVAEQAGVHEGVARVMQTI
jgi:hypothetical protein